MNDDKSLKKSTWKGTTSDFSDSVRIQGTEGFCKGGHYNYAASCDDGRVYDSVYISDVFLGTRFKLWGTESPHELC